MKQPLDLALAFPPKYVRCRSRSMRALYAQMCPLVQGDLPVLITGETGVGKEALAHILHLSSPRQQEPFVPINCAAIPADLLEAELFGIGDRVATGVAGRHGCFQQAAGGTLFLDEIAEMPWELQAKLLRVLQEKQIRPVGALSVSIDVRVVAATNADIQALMDRGEFRRDLFFRIAGFVLRAPPLRERRKDIPLLVERFVRTSSEEISKPVRGVTVRALRVLVEHDWPGNVRELEHEVRRLVYLCPPGRAIESTMISDQISGMMDRSEERSLLSGEAAREGGESPPAVLPKTDFAEETPDPRILAVRGWPSLSLSELERLMVEEALRRSKGNQVQAAKLLGISRHGLRRRMERDGLQPTPRPVSGPRNV